MTWSFTMLASIVGYGFAFICWPSSDFVFAFLFVATTVFLVTVVRDLLKWGGGRCGECGRELKFKKKHGLGFNTYECKIGHKVDIWWPVKRSNK